MVRSFYIPKDKETEMVKFVELCEKLNINYSNLLVEWIEAFNREKKGATK
jgi:hypothetical protein